MDAILHYVFVREDEARYVQRLLRQLYTQPDTRLTSLRAFNHLRSCNSKKASFATFQRLIVRLDQPGFTLNEAAMLVWAVQRLDTDKRKYRNVEAVRHVRLHLLDWFDKVVTRLHGWIHFKPGAYDWQYFIVIAEAKTYRQRRRRMHAYRQRTHHAMFGHLHEHLRSHKKEMLEAVSILYPKGNAVQINAS